MLASAPAGTSSSGGSGGSGGAEGGRGGAAQAGRFPWSFGRWASRGRGSAGGALRTVRGPDPAGRGGSDDSEGELQLGALLPTSSRAADGTGSGSGLLR